MTFKELEQKRQQNGISIAKICEDAGITERAYYYYKSNGRTPNIAVFNRLKKAVGIKRKIYIKTIKNGK